MNLLKTSVPIAPEECAETPREESPLHDCKTTSTRHSVNVALDPMRLCTQAAFVFMLGVVVWAYVGRQEPHTLLGIGDVRVDEEGVSLREDTIHVHLKAIPRHRSGGSRGL